MLQSQLDVTRLLNYWAIKIYMLRETEFENINLHSLTALNALEVINNLDLYPFYDRETNSFYEKFDGF